MLQFPLASCGDPYARQKKKSVKFVLCQKDND